VKPPVNEPSVPKHYEFLAEFKSGIASVPCVNVESRHCRGVGHVGAAQLDKDACGTAGNAKSSQTHIRRAQTE